jgi:DNA-binding SARP family transcriptional activator
MTRARSVATGLAAMAVLAAAIVGLPVVLYQFGGSPLPHHIASWHRVMVALSSQAGSGLVLALVRDCSWLAWLLFTACVLAEVQAAIRGRRSPHLRLGGLQGIAAHLVALAALAFAAPSAITLPASATAASSQSAGLHTVPERPAPGSAANEYSGAGDAIPSIPGAPEAESDVALTTASSLATVRTVTVRSGDCLWSIAQRYLGAGDRYPAIASLNYGHDMGDGQVFTNPSLIEPGWRLLLPSHSSDSAALAGRELSHRDSHAPAGRLRGQHAGHPTKDSLYRRRHAAARQHAATEHAETSQAGNGPDSVGAGIPGRARPGEPQAPAAGEAGYRTPASVSASMPGNREAEAAMFAAGALAGAVLTTLTRMRRRQHQERRRGRRIVLPADRDVLAQEQRLRAAAPLPGEPVRTLRDALACLEAGIVAAGQRLPEIVGLHVTPSALEVLLAAPAADGPPEPYAISPGRQGMCWQLELPALAAASDAPPGHGTSAVGLATLGCHLLPGLFTAGFTGDGYLLLDLESLQVTGCDGPPGLVDRVVVTAAAELATAQWSGWYDLILVGCDELEVLGRGEHCTTLAEALSLIEGRHAAASARIAERGPADVRDLRLAEPDDEDWGLTILISRFEPDPDEMMRLLALAEDGEGGIAVLVAGDTETPDGRMASAVLQVAPDPEAAEGIIANVIPLQITVRPGALSAADYAAITTLFAAASDLDDVDPDAEPYAVYAAPPWIPQAAAMHPAGVADYFWQDDEPDVGDSADQSGADPDPPRTGADIPRTDPAPGRTGPASARMGPAPAPIGSFAEVGGQHLPRTWPGPEHGLQIRILGPLVIAGAAQQLQPKQAELVLALALAAPAGLSNSALCAMLGADPDHPKPADAVRQIITRTRRRLGPAADGQEYIVHVGNGQYVLHPDATLDWTRFRELVASGRADDLRAAVSLIGGQPFSGSYFWWIDIPLIETVRAELVDAADRLAEFELAVGSPRASGRAARAGLLAEPSAEQLWRAVMQAEHAAGNLGGVTEAWRRCLDAIDDIAPDGEPHPDTVALYRQLTTVQQVPAR